MDNSLGMREPVSEMKLVVVVEAPFLPALDGGQREHLGMIEQLGLSGSISTLVILGQPNEVADAQDYEQLVGSRARVVFAPRSMGAAAYLHPKTPFVHASRKLSARWLRAFRQTVSAPDGVLSCSFKSLSASAQIADMLDLPLIMRSHNIEADYHQALSVSMPLAKRTYFQWEARRIRAIESSLEQFTRLAGVLDISQEDLDSRGQLTASIRYVPVPPCARFDRVKFDTTEVRNSILFIGSLAAETNVQGLAWFLNEVWPRVRERIPGAALNVVGRAPTNTALAKTIDDASGVMRHFDVESTRPYMSEACVAVNPIRTGSGVNIKMLEYLSSGIPVVSTSFGARGIGVEPGFGVLIADAPTDFADSICRLLWDPVFAERVGLAGQSALSKNFGQSSLSSALSEVLGVGAC
jgi:polysaccharide biosynthesis protein PslH